MSTELYPNPTPQPLVISLCLYINLSANGYELHSLHNYIHYAYRAISILCCGEDTLHVELRVRTLCELVLNEEFYLQPSIISILDPYGNEISKRALIATSARYDQACTKVNNDLSQSVLRMDCLETTKYGEYSNMWHVYGLASALKRNIISIYPEKNHRVRSLFNKVVCPRVQKESNVEIPLIIMWTRAAVSVHQNNSWTPNHFVPCFSKSSSTLGGTSTPSSTPSCTHLPASAPNVPHNVLTSNLKKAPLIPVQKSGISTSILCDIPVQSGSPSQSSKKPTQQSIPLIQTTSLFHILTRKNQMSTGKQVVAQGNKPNRTLTKYYRSEPSYINNGEKCTVPSTTSFFPSAPSMLGSSVSSSNASTVPCGDETSKSTSSGTPCSTSLAISSEPPSVTYCKQKSVSVSQILNTTALFTKTHQIHKELCHSVPITKFFHSNKDDTELDSLVNVSPYDFEGHGDFCQSFYVPKRTYNMTVDVDEDQKSCSYSESVLMHETCSSSDSDAEDSTISYCFDDGQEHVDDFQNITPDSESMDTNQDVVHIHVHDIPSSPLPFPCVSSSWYSQQYVLSMKNAARERRRELKCINKDNEGNFTFIDRSRVQGTIEQNVQFLTLSAEELTGGNKKEHIQAIIAVGFFFLQNSPVVKTQDAGKVYLEKKRLTKRKLSIEYYELFSRYLNLVQVYMFGTAFLVQNSSNVQNIVKSLMDTVDEEAVIKNMVEERLKQSFKLQLQYLDSHRDRQILKALIAELTNTSFAAKLQGLKSRKGTKSATSSVRSHLKLYTDIRTTSQIVRNDLTISQQQKLTERIISARKVNEVKTIAEGRGRKLKSKEFPELAAVLSYAFGEYDVRECGGGGLEAHPRLTTGTLYRASDNATTMKRARDIMLSYAPDEFKISLSSCYNYTENFRKGSRQAKQHHVGQGVNADISLKKPPRTGVQQFVVNLHWSTANVNLIIDSEHDKPNSLLLSKDAKAIIPANIAPVQRPGHSWNSRMVLPDHSWDQSRTNSVTPMTFLFLMTSVKQLPATSVECFETQVSDTTTIHLTRTGQGVTLLNLSFYEPETTFKCLNEIFHLLTITALDTFFRNPTTGKLKKRFTFVVDNGPAEQPSSAMVQMCLVRMMNFLKLDKVTQVSFSEYHSKRNFVERVHAEENRVLSSHGPFSSTSVHPVADAGTQKHRMNMESMAEEVRRCLTQGSFGGRQIMAFRGVKEDQFIFNDREQLENFLSLSEEGKKHFTPFSYSAVSGEMLRCLHLYWDTDEDFQGQYLSDHKSVCNEMLEKMRTAWTDKYTTSVYSTTISQRYELQPIPDYLRWLKTNELHYLLLEERALIKGPWDDIPGAFLPSKVLDLCLSVVPEPTETLVKQFSLISWTTPSDVRQYIKKVQDKIEAQFQSERERERWKSNTLYKTKTKPQLEQMCRQLKIPVTPALAKHQLTSLILEKQGKSLPLVNTTSYSGNLTAVPTTTAAINRLTITNLRSILKHHNLPIVGTKEQLVMRVFLLRHNRTSVATAREEGQIRDLIALAYDCINQQRQLYLTSHLYRKRTYTLKPSISEFVIVPSSIRSESDLTSLFQPLLSYIEDRKKCRKEKDKSSVLIPASGKESSENDAERMKIVGSKVKVKWSSLEVKESGWRPGWYAATVHKYCRESDTITIAYVTEPGVTYDEELTPLISNNKIKLISSPL